MNQRVISDDIWRNAFLSHFDQKIHSITYHSILAKTIYNHVVAVYISFKIKCFHTLE
ncbi:hypothetical protein LguiA_030509 [Lonicera macranthoides]